jgi:hypothetical protein
VLLHPAANSAATASDRVVFIIAGFIEIPLRYRLQFVQIEKIGTATLNARYDLYGKLRRLRGRFRSLSRLAPQFFWLTG